jgi:hypothetical protein
MLYKGNCHCGHICFEVEGELTKVIDCNCSICFKKGSLLWFIQRQQLRLLTPEENQSTYTFDKATIKYRFCAKCGMHPFGEGLDPSGNKVVAINVRCLEDIDLSTLQINHYDGRAL